MNITGVIAVVIFFWFILALIKPQKFAPFFKSGARKKAFLIFLAVSIVGFWAVTRQGKTPKVEPGQSRKRCTKSGTH